MCRGKYVMPDNSKAEISKGGFVYANISMEIQFLLFILVRNSNHKQGALFLTFRWIVYILSSFY